jgi:hypothetical protein
MLSLTIKVTCYFSLSFRVCWDFFGQHRPQRWDILAVSQSSQAIPGGSLKIRLIAKSIFQGSLAKYSPSSNSQATQPHQSQVSLTSLIPLILTIASKRQGWQTPHADRCLNQYHLWSIWICPRITLTLLLFMSLSRVLFSVEQAWYLWTFRITNLEIKLLAYCWPQSCSKLMTPNWSS